MTNPISEWRESLRDLVGLIGAIEWTAFSVSDRKKFEKAKALLDRPLSDEPEKRQPLPDLDFTSETGFPPPVEPSVTLLPADIDPFLQSITRSPTETLARVEPDWKHRAEEAERILADNMALANRTTRRAMDERNAIIQELRKRYSAAEIADMVGLTRQRVHQILNEAPVESSPNR